MSDMTDPLTFRTATRDDLVSIVRMLAADPLGATRESVTEPLAPEYESAFAAISDDPNNELLVAERGSLLAGVLQLTYLPSLTYQGGWRAQVEGVRVAEAMRGQGVGRALFEEAIARARRRGCRLIQLTTDNRRPEALRFYEQLGFRATHAGMKLPLDR